MARIKFGGTSRKAKRKSARKQENRGAYAKAAKQARAWGPASWLTNAGTSRKAGQTSAARASLAMARKLRGK